MSSLSVLMCNYNHAPFIGGALEAILAQSLEPKEIVVIDDGSTDNSVEVIDAYARRHPMVRLYRNERNRGVFYSANRALSMATGDYLYFAAADDRVLPGFFENAMQRAARHPDVGLIFGKSEEVDPAYQPRNVIAEIPQWREEIHAPPEVFLKDYLEVCHATHCPDGTVVFKHACVKEVGGYRLELGYVANWFMTRAIGLKHGVFYMPLICHQWRWSPDSRSVTTWTNAKPMIDVLARMVWLMRSEGFRDRFPESYARQCEIQFGEFGKWIIQQQLEAEYRRSLEWRRKQAGRLGRFGFPGRALGSVLDQVWRVCFRLGRGLQRQRLNRYRPDLSCFVKEEVLSHSCAKSKEVFEDGF